MTSWRDGISEQVQNEIEKLYFAGLDFAANVLSDYKDLLPFAMRLLKNDEVNIATVAVDTFNADDVFYDLKKILADSRDDLKAGAIVTDVLANGRDAIRVNAEHKDGLALEIILPYDRKGFRKKKIELKIEEMNVTYYDKFIWT